MQNHKFIQPEPLSDAGLEDDDDGIRTYTKHFTKPATNGEDEAKRDL